MIKIHAKATEGSMKISGTTIGSSWLSSATRTAKRLLYMAAAHAGDQGLCRRAVLKQSLQIPLSRRGHYQID